MKEKHEIIIIKSTEMFLIYN